MEVSNQKKEAYYTATQMQLVRTRFFGNRSAMIAVSILLFMIICSLFADFLSPYDPTIKGRDKDYENGAPQIPMFWDDNGFSARPFLHTLEKYRGADTNFRWFIKLILKKEDTFIFLLKVGNIKFLILI